MKVLKSGRFGQNQAHSPAVVISGQNGLEIGGGDMIWPSFGLAPAHEETVAKTSHHARFCGQVRRCHKAAAISRIALISYFSLNSRKRIDEPR
jgi:hypothetical protein